MERIRAALVAIHAERERAGEIIEKALAEDRQAFIGGLAVFLDAALHGVVIDPESL
jgi:hypothetical protein